MHHDPPSHLVQQLVPEPAAHSQEGPGHGCCPEPPSLQVVQGAVPRKLGHLADPRQATDVEHGEKVLPRPDSMNILVTSKPQPGSGVLARERNSSPAHSLDSH